MDVKVVEIEPTAQPGTYTVVFTIDGTLHEGRYEVKVVPLADVEMRVISSSTAVTDLLHGQVPIDAAISKLVGRRYDGRHVRLPAHVGRITAPSVVRQMPPPAEVEQH